MGNQILGLHHITAIAGNAKKNFEFYTQVLGLRMVKKTVNFDDPGTYHFYFGDEQGTPGSILTFFPWQHIGQGRTGSGMATEIGYSVPKDSLPFWQERFRQFNVRQGEIGERFGETYLPFQDPDGLNLNLIVPKNDDARKPWTTEAVGDNAATRGFHNVTLTLRSNTATATILTDVFGYSFESTEGNRTRFRTDSIPTASIVDLVESPKEGSGYNAAGTNHHVAFRVANEDILMEYRELIRKKGLQITPKIDRDYFYSLYFREPGGVLFELATDNPGFTRDEKLEQLGSSLKLPKQYEAQRDRIEAILPSLS